MKLRINSKSYDFDVLFIYYLILEVLFLLYFNKGQSYILTSIIVYATVRSGQMIFSKNNLTKTDAKIYPRIKTYKSVLWMVLLLFIYELVITYVQGDFTYLFSNLNYLYGPLILMIYLSLIAYLKSGVIQKVIYKHYMFFNFYYFLNTIVMVFQIRRGIDFDNIAGFFGDYGTHRLSAFVCFLVLLNLNIIRQSKAIKKIILICSTGFIIVTTFLISNYNDNTAVYIMIPITLLLYFLFMGKIKPNTLVRISLLFLTFYIGFQQLSKMIYMQTFLQQRLFNKIDGFLSVFSGGNIEEERYVYVQYALDHLNGSRVGMGMGAIKIVGDPTISKISINLRNWGISNISSLISIGGVIFSFVYICLYAKIMSVPDSKKSIFGVFFIIFLMLIYYTQVVSSIPMSICVWLMLIPFYDINTLSKNKYNI